MSTTKPKTGVEQKSSESTYGLPVSFGAGVKFDLNDRWALGIGANYTILTRKFFGTYTLVNSEGHIEESISSDIRNAQQ
jgi:opacity protein-like surface antigen